MKLKAMAKVNLGLDVLRRREDGYHEVKMIMQTVDLFDLIDIEKNNTGEIKISCNRVDLECDDNNLIYKAARKILDYAKIEQGFDIKLEKNIPIAAGMAGGSTDAAATLVGINRILNLGLSIQELKDIGVKIGADVPYCIEGGTQLSEGIGEMLTILPAAPECYVLIAKPTIGVSTKYVYENLNVHRITDHPDIDRMRRSIEANDLMGVVDTMDNILENVTIKEYPLIGELKEIMVRGGALASLMSGSGPTVFGIYSDIDAANATLKLLESDQRVEKALVTTFSKETCVEVAE